ncbi:MAG: hypothetical protein M3N31_05080 [Actinomycetota bacterium]|nr:hypothetical protein [Actinomycetota bacterium]
MRRVTPVVLALVVAGCGGDRQEREGAQTAPAVTTFEQGRFDDLPLFPRSDPIGPRSEKEGVIARSYTARGTTPERLLQFYEDKLTQWRQVEPVRKFGTSSYRAKWARDNWLLEVSSGASPALDDAGDAQVQYSLVLSPR